MCSDGSSEPEKKVLKIKFFKGPFHEEICIYFDGVEGVVMEGGIGERYSQKQRTLQVWMGSKFRISKHLEYFQPSAVQ